jgi:hypothetical protein
MAAVNAPYRRSTATTTGTIDWSMRTGGNLAAAERRRLIADLARVHVGNAVGRLSLLAHLNPGRNAYVPPAQLVPPDSVAVFMAVLRYGHPGVVNASAETRLFEAGAGGACRGRR